MNSKEQRDEWARIIMDELHPGPQDDPMTWPAQVWRLADAIVERIKPRTITTVEELDALPVGSVVLRNGRAFQRFALQPAAFDEYRMWQCTDGGFVRSTKDGSSILPATFLHEPTAEATR